MDGKVSFVTLYIYFVVNAFIGSVPCLNLKTSLKFFVIGDWGGIPVKPYNTLVQVAVSLKVSEIAQKQNADFILALGDNFYFDGVKNVNDLRFSETFEKVYHNKSLQIPWLVIAGNHDHYGNVSAQIDYSKKSSRWIFPDYFYKKTFIIPSTSSIVDILMIDTVLLCGNTDPENPYEQPTLSQSLQPTAEKYWHWIENELQSSKANYLLVCGHFPVYSIASHGSTQCLIERLVPLLEKYHVSAYLSGHDHNIQHIQMPERDWTVEYFVSGASNFVDNSKKHINDIPDSALKYHWGNLISFGAFAYVEAARNKMILTFIEGSGKELYSYSLPPRLNISHREML